MHPNLLEGDVVFVNRLAFDVKVPLTDIVVARTGDPQRGDIVTFFSPDRRHAADQARDRPAGRHDRDARQAPLHQRRRCELRRSRPRREPLAPRGVKALHVEEATADNRHEIQWLVRARSRDDFGPLAVPADHT